MYVLYNPNPSAPSKKKKNINLNKKRKAEDTESERDSDMGDILYDDGINSLFNGSSKEKVETEENDGDDDQWSDEIDQSHY